jgi:hypothetical protein
MSTAAAERDPRDLLSRRTSSSNTSGNAIGFVSKHINNDRMKNAADQGMQWYYNWNPTPDVTDTAGLQFIPEQWAVGNTGMVAPSGPTQDIVLMYNEPDNPGGLSSSLCFDNGHPSHAAAQRMAETYCRQISQFKDLGYQKFGSPAWQFDPSNPGAGQDNIVDGCLMPFFEAVAQNAECKAATNIFVWHMYTKCTNQSDVQTFCHERTDDYKTIMEQVESTYGFNFDGMYVTEFAGWGPECVQNFGGDGSAGQAMVAEFCTPILQNAPRMIRFAWFNDFEDYADQGQGTSDLFNDDNSLSVIGQAYLRAVSGSAGSDVTGTITHSASIAGGNSTDADSTTVSPSTVKGSTTVAPSTVGGSTTTESPSTTDSDSSDSSTTDSTTAAPSTTHSDSSNVALDESKPLHI